MEVRPDLPDRIQCPRPARLGLDGAWPDLTGDSPGRRGREEPSGLREPFDHIAATERDRRGRHVDVRRVVGIA